MAILYGVETKNLNKAIGRNKSRFPEDFIIKLTESEWNNLKFQIGTSNSKWGGRRKLPNAFTEHGVVMAANLLRSQQAIKISVEIVRAFIRLREFLNSHKELVKEVGEMKSFLLKYSNKTDREFKKVWSAIENLIEPKKPAKEARKIGFDLEKYRN